MNRRSVQDPGQATVPDRNSRETSNVSCAGHDLFRRNWIWPPLNVWRASRPCRHARRRRSTSRTSCCSNQHATNDSAGVCADTTIASSWICGAIVGAVAMFVYEGRPTLMLDPSAVSTSGQKGAAQAEPADTRKTSAEVIQPPRKYLPVAVRQAGNGSTDFAWLVAAELTDPYGHGHARRGRDSSTWRVGMSLPGIAMAAGQDANAVQDANVAPSPETPASESVTPPSRQRDLEPAPPITREQLLRELIDRASGPIL